ncbi:transposase [Streptomyces lydicus]|uniref:transposase n=1 Tax=Streptomyces lydicus TaxID=47763 RepID=UPI0037AF0694
MWWPGSATSCGAGSAPTWDEAPSIVDTQSVKGAETVSQATRGYDAVKKINGRKRYIAVDTKGMPVMIMVTPADMTDRAAAREMLWRLRLTHPQITQVWADSAYASQLVNWADDFLRLTLKPSPGRAAREDSWSCPAAGKSKGHWAGSCMPAAT